MTKIRVMVWCAVGTVWYTHAMDTVNKISVTKTRSFASLKLDDLLEKQINFKKESDTYKKEQNKNALTTIDAQRKVLQAKGELLKLLLKKKKIGQIEYELRMKKIALLAELYDTEQQSLDVELKYHSITSFNEHDEQYTIIRLYQDALKKILIMAEEYEQIQDSLHKAHTKINTLEEKLKATNKELQETVGKHDDLDDFVTKIGSRLKSLEYQKNKDEDDR